MAPVRIVAALATALLAALPPAGAAAPYSVRLGLEKIVLDAPPGFSDTTELASPRLQDLAATLTSDSNRVLLFALSDSDLRRFTQGDQLEMRRYVLAATPKGAERERLSAEQFSVLVNDSARALGKPVEEKDLVKFLEGQPIGLAHLLSELKKEPTVVSVMQAVRLPPLPGATMFADKKPQYQVSTTTLMLVKDRALQLAIFTMYEGPADADWLRTTTQRWIEEIRRLNAR
jgi:hypothetical protein